MCKRARMLPIAAVVAVASLACVSAAGQGLLIPQYRDAIAGPAVKSGCSDCGTVRSVREITARRDPKVHGTGSASAFDGRVVGAVIVLPFGSSKDAQVGGVGTAAMNEQLGLTSYEVTILMDDGSYRTLQRRDGGRFTIGDRVRLLTDGRVQPLSDAAPRSLPQV